MADSFNWSVLVDIATKGAKGTEAEIRSVANAVDQLSRENKLGEKDTERHTRTLDRMGKQATSTSGNVDRLANSTNSLRYANYDLASTLLGVSAGLTAVGAATVTAFASQESAFTTVERITTGSAASISELRDELQALSTELPVSFQGLSEIASLGAALDIPAESLAKFTETVAKFSATTGVTTEAAAAGFGRLAAYLEIPQEQFDALGSAILKAGNISVATEEQVLKFAQALALPGARAGISAEQVVGLGATIASFGNINVEGAGSAVTRIFTGIDRAVRDGEESLNNFAAAAGYSAQQFGIAWEQDAGAVLNRVLAGLNSDVGNLATNLDTLGFRNVRDRRVLEALVLQYDKYRSILGETTSAWREGTYMNEAYGLVLDDIASKFQIFLNAVTNAAAAIGSALAPAIGALLDGTTDLLVNLAAFASSPLGQFFTRMAVGILAAVAAWAALRGGIALATAATFAFNTATSLMGGKGIIAGIRGLATALGIYTAATGTATRGTINFATAFKVLGRATVVIGILSLLGQLFLDLGGTVQWAGEQISRFGSFLRSLNWGGAFNEGAEQIRDFGNSVQEWSKHIPRASTATEDFERSGGNLNDVLAQMDDEFGNVEDSAAAMADQVRTLVDYANDLSSVWSRAFEIRFTPQQTLDAITTSFQGIRDASEAARRNIRGLQAEISGLNSDINIQQQFLGIAQQYGDTTRAQAIQANLSKLQADLAEKTASLAEEREKDNKTLVGNSKAAIQNRTTLTGLVQQYQAHIQSLANSGLSTEELQRQTEQLRQDFITQATQLGFNRGELGLYEQSFRDVTVAIQNVPRDITVNFNADPALQAMNEFVARSQQAGQNAGQSFASGFNTGVDDMRMAMEKATSIIQLVKDTWGGGSSGRSRSGGGSWGGLGNPIADWAYDIGRNIRGYADGGYTGRGGKYEAAGVVHRGEYVIPAKHVNQATGLPNADAMGRLQRGAPTRQGYANGGFVRGGGMGGQVTLSPTSIQQLAMVMDKIISLDGRVVGETASRSYQTGTTVGKY
jgi:TP901 family phage tail tape measure protein